MIWAFLPGVIHAGFNHAGFPSGKTRREFTPGFATDHHDCAQNKGFYPETGVAGNKQPCASPLVFSLFWGLRGSCNREKFPRTQHETRFPVSGTQKSSAAIPCQLAIPHPVDTHVPLPNPGRSAAATERAIVAEPVSPSSRAANIETPH